MAGQHGVLACARSIRRNDLLTSSILPPFSFACIVLPCVSAKLTVDSTYPFHTSSNAAVELLVDLASETENDLQYEQLMHLLQKIAAPHPHPHSHAQHYASGRMVCVCVCVCVPSVKEFNESVSASFLPEPSSVISVDCGWALSPVSLW